MAEDSTRRTIIGVRILSRTHALEEVVQFLLRVPAPAGAHWFPFSATETETPRCEGLTRPEPGSPSIVQVLPGVGLGSGLLHSLFQRHQARCDSAHIFGIVPTGALAGQCQALLKGL